MDFILFFLFLYFIFIFVSLLFRVRVYHNIMVTYHITQSQSHNYVIIMEGYRRF